MSHATALLLCALLLLSGCRRRSSPPPAAPVPEAPETAAAAAPTRQGGQQPRPAENQLPKELQASTPGVAQMNLAVQEFVTQMGRPPTRLEELLEKRVLPRFPPASPGMKYVLTKGRNNQPEVKEVSQ